MAGMASKYVRKQVSVKTSTTGSTHTTPMTIRNSGIGEKMAKSTEHNMCRRALLNGKNVCKEKDLLTECENWSRVLQIPNVTKGCLDTHSIKRQCGQKMKTTLKH